MLVKLTDGWFLRPPGEVAATNLIELSELLRELQHRGEVDCPR
jgi:hypothetical protein